MATRALAEKRATELGHILDPESGWRWVDEPPSITYKRQAVRGSIANCFACWRDMVVIQVPEQMMTGPMLEEKCDHIAGFIGQPRLEGL